jgi:hypothetical protein
MASSTLTDCTQLDSTLLERVNYFPRQLLTADDMTADQEYFIAKFRRHNRYLHGWGVVCGLEVTVAPTTQKPWQVQIGAGYALGPYGDEIYVPNPVMLDLAQCGPGASTDPCDSGTLLQGGIAKTGSLFYIAIRYEECLSRPVRVLPGGCGCSDNSCEPSRISDSYEIECLADLPPSNQPGQGPSLCDILNGSALAQCPPCPSDPWVVLAQVTLPAALGSTLPQSNIDNVTVRRKIFSTAMIQEQVRLCCCAGTDRAPARVTSITPASGTVFTNNTTIPPVMLVTFNKHLVAASVNTNTILVLRVQPTGISKAVQSTVTYDDGTQTATFTPADSFTIPGDYQITVVGSGPNVITDSDNLALDGNADGLAGGNFLSEFSVQIPSVTPTPTPTASPTPTPSPTPTQAPVPLTIVVNGPNPVPNIGRANPTAVGDLGVTFAGGPAGQTLVVNVTVTLNTNLGKTGAADTAVWTDSQGNNIQATKGANTYTLTGVSIKQTGSGTPVNAKIANMKIDSTQLGIGTTAGGNTAIAIVSMTSATSLPAITGASQTVAKLG